MYYGGLFEYVLGEAPGWSILLALWKAAAVFMFIPEPKFPCDGLKFDPAWNVWFMLLIAESCYLMPTLWPYIANFLITYYGEWL